MGLGPTWLLVSGLFMRRSAAARSKLPAADIKIRVLSCGVVEIWGKATFGTPGQRESGKQIQGAVEQRSLRTLV